MKRTEFRAWLSAVDTLSEARKAEAGAILAGRPADEASLAAIEPGVGEDRCRPHRGASVAVANGKARGMQRYRCRACKRTFGALTGARLSVLRRKQTWLTFGECFTADAVHAVLAPLLDKDALLFTDGNSIYSPFAAAPGVSHEAFSQSAGERVRGEPSYPDRQ
jgi:hypothetical protein